MLKETFYFSHDYGSRNDPKLAKLLQKKGQEGKGIYWDLVEMLYEQSGYLLLNEIDTYAFAMRTECERIKKQVNSELLLQIINDFGLFKNDGERFWSESVLSRLNLRYEKSEKAKQSAQSRWNKSDKNANALRTQSDGNAIKERKVKEKENAGETPDFFIRVEKFVAMFNDLRNTKFKPIKDVQDALRLQVEHYTPEQIKFALKNAIKDKYHIENNFKSLTPKYLLQTDILEKYVNIQQIPHEVATPGSFKIDHSQNIDHWNKTKQAV